MADSIINPGIDAALIEFSYFRPNPVFGSIPLQIGVTDYPFPMAGSPLVPLIDSVVDFFYSPFTDLAELTDNYTFEEIVLLGAFQGIGAGGGLLGAGFGGSVFENPSLVTIWYSKLNQFRSNFGRHEWLVVPGQPSLIRLSTMPTRATTAYYEGRAMWTLDTITERDRETFMKCVLWKTSEIRSMSLAVVTNYYEFGGIRIEPAFAYWEKKAQDFQKQFMDDVGANSGVMVIG